MKRILDRRFGWSLEEVVLDPRDSGAEVRRQEELRRAEEERRRVEEEERADAAAARASGFNPDATGIVITTEEADDPSAPTDGDGGAAEFAGAGDPATRPSTRTTGGTAGAGTASGTGAATRSGSGTASSGSAPSRGAGSTSSTSTRSDSPRRYTGPLREDGTPADAVTVDPEAGGLQPNFGSDEIVRNRPDLQALLTGAGERATARHNREISAVDPKTDETKLPPEPIFPDERVPGWSVPMTPSGASQASSDGRTFTPIPSEPISDLKGTAMQGVYQFEGKTLRDGHFVVVPGATLHDADWVGYVRGTMNDPTNYPQSIQVFSRRLPEYMQNRFYDWVVTDESGARRTPEEALNFVHQILVGNEDLPPRFQPQMWETEELNYQLNAGKGNKADDVTKAGELFAQKQRGLTSEQKRAILSTTDAKEAIRLLEGKGADLQTSAEILEERSDHWTEGQQRELEKWEEKRAEVEARSKITDPNDPRARQLAILEAISVDLPAEGREIAEKREAAEALADFYRQHGTAFRFDRQSGTLVSEDLPTDETEAEYVRLIHEMETAGVEPEILSAITGETPVSDGTSSLTPEGVLNLYLGNTPAAQIVGLSGIPNLFEQEQQVQNDIARLEDEVDPAIMDPLVEDVGFLRDYDRFASALNEGRYPEMRALHQKQFGSSGGFNDRNVTADGREYYREQRKNRRTEGDERLQAFQNAARTPGQIGQEISTLAGLPDTVGKALRSLGETLGLDITDAQLQTYLGRIDKYATGENSRRKGLLDKQLKVEKREAPKYESGTALAGRVDKYVVDGHGKDVAQVDTHDKEVAATATQWAQTDSTETEKENKANRKKPRFVTPHKTWIEV